MRRRCSGATWQVARRPAGSGPRGSTRRDHHGPPAAASGRWWSSALTIVGFLVALRARPRGGDDRAARRHRPAARRPARPRTRCCARSSGRPCSSSSACSCSSRPSSTSASSAASPTRSPTPTGGDAARRDDGLLWFSADRLGDHRQHPLHGDGDPGRPAAGRDGLPTTRSGGRWRSAPASAAT